MKEVISVKLLWRNIAMAIPDDSANICSECSTRNKITSTECSKCKRALIPPSPTDITPSVDRWRDCPKREKDYIKRVNLVHFLRHGRDERNIANSSWNVLFDGCYLLSEIVRRANLTFNEEVEWRRISSRR